MSRIAPPVRNTPDLCLACGIAYHGRALFWPGSKVAFQHEHVVTHGSCPHPWIIAARMVFVHRALQPRLHHMGINLRGGNVRMPEHGLHATKIRSSFQQMRREAVPEPYEGPVSVAAPP